MTEIRSLADQLREKMRQGEVSPEELPLPPAKEKKQGKRRTGKSSPVTSPEVEKLLTFIAAFPLPGQEKLLIRLDERTVFMMKQLKVTRNIDMNKLIAFCVDQFFTSHPELIDFIKSTLQTIDL